MSGLLTSRWFVLSDLPEVLDIERRCFRQHAWDKRDFRRFLQHQSCTIRVAERYGRVLGYVAYELHLKRVHLMSLAVHPEEQGTGVGTHLLGCLTDRMSDHGRERMTTEVSEDNVAAQVFFKKAGFRWFKTLGDYYENAPGLDAYSMELLTPCPECVEAN